MFRSLCILVLILTIGTSCSRQTTALIEGEIIFAKNFSSITENNCNSDLNDFKIDFVEDAGAYLIFQVEISNYDQDSLFIGSDDFTGVFKNDDFIEGIPIEILDKSEMIKFLEEEQVKLKKEKKGRTITSAILTGLEVLSIAAGPGGDVGTALIYAAESGAYIADDRNSFKVAELSIEDEIKYLEDWVLHETSVLPDEVITSDILVSGVNDEGDILFTITLEDNTCQVRYKMRFGE